jgi:hypothetical protein
MRLADWQTRGASTARHQVSLAAIRHSTHRDGELTSSESIVANAIARRQRSRKLKAIPRTRLGGWERAAVPESDRAHGDYIAY